MKIIFLVFMFHFAGSSTETRIPACVTEKATANSILPYTIKTALYHTDTCFVVVRKTIVTAKMTRHEIQMRSYERTKPDFVQPEVYDQNCRRLTGIKNKDLKF